MTMKSKKVFWIRHGHALHNAAQEQVDAVLCEKYPDMSDRTTPGFIEERKKMMFAALNGEDMLDPPLSAKGKLQVQQFHQEAEKIVRFHGVEVVLSSSLQRALMTATAFEGVPIVALDELREVAGAFDCERRRPLSVLAEEFPNVEFGFCSQDDLLWTQYYRDAMKQSVARGVQALEVIMARPEKTLAIVSHGAFMATAVFSSPHPQMKSTSEPPRYNCEMKEVQIRREANGSFSITPLLLYGSKL
eukprot:gnl/MRDRNA2_/MRDRNA2_181618_c0_seq1.p1 gnl/MRDRNA2_/MRDRNA2_181618_c0~~gnl/MRDRNA2_/MRDRNA2_181618_c0_seq1.p1  ORF type:complete len:246 (+),score=58.22 gnl/MRDRNA2_/MRDRNA2_181618_c0_seq1:170-907(+)